MPGPKSTESNYEKTFSDLAYARMRDKAPTLLDYILGFQLIDKNDEETHAVGVYGFKVGSELVYAPVFFINGELKGHELLFIKSQDAFVPLTEEWVNYILNRRPQILGSTEKTPRHRLGLRQPDFDILARTPYIGSKYASAKRPSFKEIRARMDPDMQDFMDSAFLTSPRSEKFASLEEKFTIPAALKILGKKAAINLVQTMRKDHDFADAILKFYDPDELLSTKLAQDLVDQEELQKKMRKGEHTFPKVRVITSFNGSNGEEELTEAEKSKVLCSGFVVRDKRKDGEKSRLYKTQIAAAHTNPGQTGFYDVVNSKSDTIEALVIIGPKHALEPGRGSNLALVIDWDTKDYGLFAPHDIMTSKQHFSDWQKKFEGLSGPSSLSMGDFFVLVREDGTGTMPMCIDSKWTDSEGTTDFTVRTHTDATQVFSPRVNYERQGIYGTTPRFCCGNHDTTIHLTDKDNDSIEHLGSAFYIGKKVKVIKLKNEKSKGYNWFQPKLNLCNPSNIVADIYKSAELKEGYHQLQVRSDGVRYTVVLDGQHSARLTKSALYQDLIENKGLSEDSVDYLVSQVQGGRSKSDIHFLKYAFTYTASGDVPNQASFPDPLYGSEPGLQVKTHYPQTMLQGLGTINSSGNRDNYTRSMYIDEDARNNAQQASQMGQKEILDTSVISGLVKTVDTDSTIDSYIGDLLLGLDRVGRILFMFYWHNDKFKDRYGRQDMVELEDNLRNVFKNLGELSLFLKQKTIEPDNDANSEVDLANG
jgi:hypothetical protein